MIICRVINDATVSTLSTRATLIGSWSLSSITDNRVTCDALMPLLISLNKDGDSSILLLLCLLLLMHKSAWVLLHLRSDCIVQMSRVLAVTGIAGHISMFASTVLERFGLVSAIITVNLSAILKLLLLNHLFVAADVTWRHQVTTFLNKLVLYLTKITV